MKIEDKLAAEIRNSRINSQFQEFLNSLEKENPPVSADGKTHIAKMMPCRNGISQSSHPSVGVGFKIQIKML